MNPRSLLPASFALYFICLAASAQDDYSRTRNGNLDKRREAFSVPVLLEGARANAADRLRASMEGIEIDLDDVVGSPKFIRNRDGFLSPPASVREMDARLAGEPMPSRTPDADPDARIREFLDNNSDLFGHGSEALAGARKTRDYTTEHSGMRTVVWQQELDGIPVFEAVLYGHVARNGELVSLCSQFVPEPERAADAGAPNRLRVQVSPPISPHEAIADAAAGIGDDLRAEEISEVDLAPEGNERKQRFQAEALVGDATASLVWLPMNRDTMRLCWRVTLTGKTSGELYQVLIDAENGEPQVRHCWTAYFQQASFRVFDSDSPTPGTPGWTSPTPQAQPTFRPQVDKLNVSSTASPNGWLHDGETRTIGNNVDAHLDIRNDNPVYNGVILYPEQARPSGTLVGNERRFWFTADLSQPPKPMPQGANPASSNQKAAVVNAFYWCNWMHDKLYGFGFTEAVGNFQWDNLGRGGVGGDPVLVDVQDGAEPASGPALRNQNRMSAMPEDGVVPRMLLQLFDGPLLIGEKERDAALAAEIILHEYTHGMNQRLVGHGTGVGGLFGLDEGWADFMAMACLSEAGNDPTLTYPSSGYTARNWKWNFGTQTRVEANYYYGLLLFPYSTSQSMNPLTFRDLDPAQGSQHTGVARSPTYPADLNDPDNGPIKAQQLWAATLWEMRGNLVANHGFTTGNDLAMRLVVDSLKLCPPNPNFLQARDALLLADQVYTGGANKTAIWQAFKNRGMGARATSPAGTATSGIVENFDMPPASGAWWTYTAGNAISSSPAIGADGTIYVGSSDGKVYAIYPNGQQRWAYTEPTTYISFNSSPMVGPDGTIYARRQNGYLYAINPSGTLKWKRQVYYDSWVSPALGRDGTIYVAGQNPAHGYAHCLHALRPSDGVILWSYDTGNTIYSSPAIAQDGTIYFGCMDTKVYAIDPVTHQAKNGWPVFTGGAVVSSPAIGTDGTSYVVYVGSYDGKLYAIGPNGTVKWAVMLSAGSIVDTSPAVGPDGTIYVGSQDGKLFSINPAAGQINDRWPYVTGYTVRSSPAVGLDGTVYIGSYNGKMTAVNPDATLRWSYSSGGLIFSSPAIGPDGTVYFGSGNYKLHALAGGTPLARPGWPMFRQNARHTGTALLSVSFVGADECPPGEEICSRGTWKPYYGDLGYHIIGDPQGVNYPEYLQVSPSGHLTGVWEASTTNVVALQKVVGNDRIAACWYAEDQFSIGVTLTDGSTRRLGLYLLDWDMFSRSLRIDVSDVHSGFVFDSREVLPSSDGASFFSGGAYYFWQVAGSVRFDLTRLAGPNAVVSGLFLD